MALPVERLPPELAAFSPDGVQPVSVAGRALVTVALVRYAPGSVLTYDELLVAVTTRAGRRPAVTLPHIWVDSPESVAGGRELWAIPKGLAEFDFDLSGPDVAAGVRVEGREVAKVHGRMGARVLPGWQAASLTTAQRLEGRSVLAINAARGHARMARFEWRFDPDGPLAYLAAAKPLISLALDRMGISFGLSVARS